MLEYADSEQSSRLSFSLPTLPSCLYWSMSFSLSTFNHHLSPTPHLFPTPFSLLTPHLLLLPSPFSFSPHLSPTFPHISPTETKCLPSDQFHLNQFYIPDITPLPYMTCRAHIIHISQFHMLSSFLFLTFFFLSCGSLSSLYNRMSEEWILRSCRLF